MIRDIAHEMTYAHPPDLVWRALTTRDALRAWLMENDLAEAKVGARFQFTDRPRPFWDGVCACEVAEADPARRLVLRWGVNAKSPTTVSWTLTPAAGGGTHVALRHAGFSGVTGWVMRKGMDRGWHRIMERSVPVVLAALAAGKTPSREEAKRAASGK